MVQKLKILLASETFPPDVNGASIFVYRLAQMLSNDGHEVLVVAPSVNYQDQYENINAHLAIQRVKSVALKPIHPYFRAVWKVGLTKKIKKAIHDFKPDIVHIHNHFLLGRTCLAIAKKQKIPVIGTNHFMPDNLTEYFPKIFEAVVANYMWKDFIRVYNQLDFVTAPTQVALDMIKELGIEVSSEVISNGLDLNKFKKHSVQKSSYKKFQLHEDIPTFLFVGRLERDKNIELVLSALDLNRNKIPFQMLIVGTGNDEKNLRKMSRDLKLNDLVHFTGKISDSDLNQAYSLADVYIGSGGAELQGLAVMEAMAMGLPVLAANAVALPELVKNNKNGYLFELDPNDLAEKMRKILEDSSKLKSMSAQSLRIIKKHSQEHTLKSFLKLYVSSLNFERT